MNKPTETGYIEAFNRKEKKAWECFYSDYYVALCAYSDRLIGDSSDAEDVVQDTLIKVWDATLTFPSMQELSWYLYKAVYVNSLYFLRTRKRRSAILEKAAAEVSFVEDDFFRNTLREELIRQCRGYVARLPREARKILELSMEGLSGAEIAEKLGISIHTVKSQKNRSFKILRNKLQGGIYFSLFFSKKFHT